MTDYLPTGIVPSAHPEIIEFAYSDYLAGMITMGYLVSAAFFLQFWSRTKDALFLSFALAFLLIAISAAFTSLLQLPLEEYSWIYLLRLAAFLLLIAAILQNNLAGQK